MAQFKHISREEAAKRLNISVRTVDRHIRKGSFDVKRINRKVFISKPSFERYYGERVEAGEIQEIQPEEQVAVEAERPVLTAHEHPVEQGSYGALQPTQIYKELYEEVKVKFEEQQKRLEGAHYRVGQLEAQLKNMVPLLEVKQERKKMLLLDRQYKEKVQQAKVRVVEEKRRFQSERFNKNVFVALVYGLLALQPIFWVVMRG